MKTDWSKSHCGVMLCSMGQTIELMPEVQPMLDELIPHLELPVEDYVVDVKVHMLMPNEYPCIPNWHRDFVPRDEALNKIPKDISGEKMYIWVSGEPKTEWKKPPKKLDCSNFDWIEFTQRDVHRGVVSKQHTWRCFIRVIPKKFIHPSTINVGQLRRHSQVYIETPDKFSW
jgi:hypothetical protein